MPARDPDSYLATLSADKRATLEKLRRTIRAAAPSAKEGMSYGMPAFIQGKPIAGYAAGANHCSYFPMSGAIVEALGDELAGYDTSKGTIRFPIGKPLPAKLVRKLIVARLAEIDLASKPAIRTTAKRAGRRTDPDVDALMRELDHPLAKEIESVRHIILGVSPSIAEGVKWNGPSFRTEKEFFATVHTRSKDTVQVILHLGAKNRPNLKAFEIADPKGLMKWLGKDRAIVTLGTGRELTANRSAFASIVKAWIAHV